LTTMRIGSGRCLGVSTVADNRRHPVQFGHEMRQPRLFVRAPACLDVTYQFDVHVGDVTVAPCLPNMQAAADPSATAYHADPTSGRSPRRRLAPPRAPAWRLRDFMTTFRSMPTSPAPPPPQFGGSRAQGRQTVLNYDRRDARVRSLHLEAGRRTQQHHEPPAADADT